MTDRLRAADPREGTADALRAAAETMHAVRDRCVWTQQITHRDLVPYLVEESAELVYAVEEGTRADLREELGDLLWQVLFHAEIASRDPHDPFDIDDVARGLTDKMVRRHPHVFAGETAETPERVLELWNAAKAAEKRERTSVLDGVSERMPSLALAQKLLGKAAGVRAPEPVVPAAPAPAAPTGPTGPTATPAPTGSTATPAPTARLRPRIETAGTACSLDAPLESRGDAGAADAGLRRGVGDQRGAGQPGTEAELGDALLALVAVAREHGWDAERALRERLRVLTAQIRAAEGR